MLLSIRTSSVHAGLCDIPDEIKLFIVKLILGEQDCDLDDQLSAVQKRHLVSLGSTNRLWRAFIQPFLFRYIDLRKCRNERLFDFVGCIVPKYGRYCRSLCLSLRSPVSGGRNSTTKMRRPLHYSDTWHAERGTLLAVALRSMPSVRRMTLSIQPCLWHRTAHRLNCCECLLAYSNFVSSLTGCPVQSLRVELDYDAFANDACDDLLQRVLQNVCGTLKQVALIRTVWSNWRHHDLPYTRAALTSLPHLEDMKLVRMFDYEELESLGWLSGLRKLCILAPTYEDSEIEPQDTVQDISYFLQALPDTLEHLTVESSQYYYEASMPFPSHLAALQSLSIHLTIDIELMQCFSHCCASTVSISGHMILEADEVETLMQSSAAFPALKRLNFRVLGLRNYTSDDEGGVGSSVIDEPGFVTALTRACEARSILLNVELV